MNPTEEDWRTVKRVFHYLVGTRNLGLKFTGKGKELEGFSMQVLLMSRAYGTEQLTEFDTWYILFQNYIVV